MRLYYFFQLWYSEIRKIVLNCHDLKVESTSAQVEYKSAIRRSIKLDIRAIDTKGRVADIEIQRSDRGTGAKRARFHSSMIDRTLLAKGEDFEELADTYVIFITENDKFQLGMPLYHIDRTILEMEHIPFQDGSHIIYVNGEFQDLSHPVGRLMHDFHCKNAGDMINPLLAKEVRYLKEEGGKGYMCRMLEEMREEAAAKATVEATHNKAVKIAIKMLNMGCYSLEEITKITELSMEEVQELVNTRTA